MSIVEKEINKFLKKIKTSGAKERVELHNIVGGLYTDIGLYDEARNHHEKALDLCRELGDSVGIALAYRHIGEAKASSGLFDEANEDVHKYLELSQKCNNQIEVQRALTTLGRVQLMQAQHMNDEDYYHSHIKRAALRAEKTFQKALNLTNAIKHLVESKEFDQMYAGLLVNMGLVRELCGKRLASIETLCEARELYKTARLKEDLFRCLILLTSINRQGKEMGKASLYSKEAFDVAKGIGKKLLLCEAYIELGLVHITLRQFKEAKRAFKFAHREGSPNEEDHKKAQNFRKISHLISDTFSKLEQQDLTSAMRSQYAERIGDLFVKLGCYSQAVIYYSLSLDHARVCQKPKKELAKILFSLAETYYDDGQLEKALKCYDRELNWSSDEKARCQTMFRIALVRDQLNHNQSDVCEAYEKALKHSDKYIILKQTILENYLAFMKEKHCNVLRYREVVKMKKTIDDCCNEDGTESLVDEVDIGESELEEEIANLNVDDFLSDDEDEDDEVLMLNRRRPTKKFRTNEFGETPLHEAIIRGDLKRVNMLLQQGHDVNPRDNLGWTPLHEACNFGHYEIAQMLIERGADVSNNGPKGMTPLHDAASNGHFEVMRLLMKNKANVVALTSKGESVLRCLREYKKRQGNKMSNRELCAYKEAETDLIDLMDKCGFDLMSDIERPSTSKNIQEPPHITALKSNLRNEPEVVKDYRSTLGHLKRKQRSPEPDPICNKKPNPEVTYEPEFDPRAPTKQWLSDIQDEECDDEDEDIDNDIVNINDDDLHNCRINKPTNDAPPASPHLPYSQTLLTSRTPENLGTSPISSIPSTSRSSPIPLILPTSPIQEKTYLYVHIEKIKLLVQIPDSKKTIKWLKEAIVDRYHAVAGNRPCISLAPIDEPDCIISDQDTCQLFPNNHIVAQILYWNLENPHESYVQYCEQSSPPLKPLTFIERELINLGSSQKLDLSYARFPNNHIQPIFQSFAKRSYTTVKLTGSSCLFRTNFSDFILNTIYSWLKLVNIELRCVGILRSHFVALCRKLALKNLKSIDLSFNCISYKRKEELKEDLEMLVNNNPALIRVDLSKNQLKFMSSISSASTSDTSLTETLGLNQFGGNEFELIANEQNHQYTVAQVCDY